MTEQNRTGWRKRQMVIVAGLLAAGALLLTMMWQPISAQTPAAKGSSPASKEQVARGDYLVKIAGCNDCHTPWVMGAAGPQPDMTRMLAGHPQDMPLPPPPPPSGPWIWCGAGSNTAFAGPWGITYAPNLTPDETTGMGVWTEEMFVKAMRTGKHFGTSRPIMPPMPWPALSSMTDEDLKAVYAYLRSIPPIKNLVPDYAPPAPPPAPEKK